MVDYLYQIRKNNKYEPEMYKIEHIDEVLNLMSAITNDNRFEEVIEEVHEKEAKYMCEVIDIMLNKGWQEAMEEGIQKGLEEGIQEGLEKGIQEGAEIEKKNIAQVMKEKGFDVGLIMEVTGLSKDKILAL